MESVPTTTDSKMAVEEHSSADDIKNHGSGVEDKKAEKPERSPSDNVNEDKIMTEKTLAVISQNIDKTVFPTVPQQSSPTTIQKPPQPLSPGVPHSPTFSGPAANKPQIPVSDSCVGTYTSKSAENLPDVVAPQEKEKSPNPKRERMRDKLMNALPSMNSSRHPNDGLVFGVELSLVEQDDKFKVPRFVVECVEILKEQENIETSGLYRASGNKNSIENIKKKLNEKRSPKKYEFLKKQDVHSLTGSLKLFFRELKSPLIAKDVYESCVQQTKGCVSIVTVLPNSDYQKKYSIKSVLTNREFVALAT